MSKYFRPIINFENIYPTDAIFLGSTRLWFNSVKVFERGKDSIIINAKDIPNKVKLNLVEKREAICGIQKRSPLVVGVLNRTPDSFSDGATSTKKNDLIIQVDEMINEGADIIDIGGESTRPNFETILPNVEINRIELALKLIRDSYPKLPISIDTRKSSVAEYALDRGAKILNDVSSLTFDNECINIVKRHESYICLMHNSGDGKNLHNKVLGKDFLIDIFDYLKERIQFAELNGISKSKIIIDPGIGFGKTEEQNLGIIANISLFHTLGCPILVGASRKKFIGDITEVDIPANRMLGSIIIAGELAKQGVQLIRVHDVKETNQIINILNRLNSCFK